MPQWECTEPQMNKFTSMLRNSNTIQRLIKIARYLGIDGLIKTFVFAVAVYGWTIVVRVVDQSPFWLATLVSVLTVIAVVRLFAAIKTALSLRGIKEVDIPKIGEDCQRLYREAAGFLAQRRENEPRWMDAEGDEVRRRHSEMASYGNVTNARMMEKFGTHALALSHVVGRLGIPQPNAFSLSHGDSGGVIIYLGIVGDLLKDGLLEEARTLDPNMTWGQRI